MRRPRMYLPLANMTRSGGTQPLPLWIVGLGRTHRLNPLEPTLLVAQCPTDSNLHRDYPMWHISHAVRTLYILCATQNVATPNHWPNFTWSTGRTTRNPHHRLAGEVVYSPNPCGMPKSLSSREIPANDAKPTITQGRDGGKHKRNQCCRVLH